MTPKEAYMKAGKIHAEVCRKSRPLIKPGAKLLDITRQIEKWIIDSGASLAFPVNLQLNNIVHYSCPPNDETIITKDDLIKVDVGVHVEGYIADGAFTVTFDKDYQDMVDFTEKTLMHAITNLKPGMPISEIGRRLDESLEGSKYKIVRNLMGHQVQQWDLHSTKSVVVYENKGNKNTLDPGEAYAIEIFITDGAGMIKAAPIALIYSIKKQAPPLRDAKVKKMVQDIYNRRRTLPFTERYVTEHLNYSKIDFFNLRKSGALFEYNMLVETPGSKVAQFEHVIYVDEDEVIITTKH